MKKILLDSCFLIGLLDKDSIHHKNAYDFFVRFSSDNDVILKISTIAISEFSIRGDAKLIPVNVQILPFNYAHAIKAGEFGKVVSKCRKETNDGSDRAIVLNDSKMFAQAEIEHFDCFVSTDTNAFKAYGYLKNNGLASFEFLDVSKVSCYEYYNELNFDTL